MNATARYAVRAAFVNLTAFVLCFLLFSGVSVHTPAGDFLRLAAISFVLSNFIGVPLSVLMPRVGRSALCGFPFPINWILMTLVMVGIALAGSALGLVTLLAVGYLDALQFGAWFLSSAKVVVIVTLLFGTAVSVYESLRARLETAELAVRTKERDEAEARRVATEARLASLEARVQPHFLFNTLNSIAALIPGDPSGAERMIEQLASLMRSALSQSRSPLVTLGQELEVVRDYLEIERVRFGNRLRYRIDVPAGAADVPVPRMSLQTLVENSVKYAVSPRREGGSVTISASVRDRRCRLSVEDDGPGFNGERLPDNHGLALLRDRLAYTFEGQAALDVRPARGATIVSIDLPAPHASLSDAEQGSRSHSGQETTHLPANDVEIEAR